MFRWAKNLLTHLRKTGWSWCRSAPDGVPVYELPACRIPAAAFPVRHDRERHVVGLGEYEAGTVEEVALPVPRRPLDDWLLG